MRGDETDSARLRELDGRDRPLPIVASDRDSQAIHFVKPNVLHRSGLSIGEDHRLADKLDLGLLELAEDRGCTNLHNWHLVADSVPWLDRVGVAFERCTSRDRPEANGCPGEYKTSRDLASTDTNGRQTVRCKML
jgi:hypothetical protein